MRHPSSVNKLRGGRGIARLTLVLLVLVLVLAVVVSIPVYKRYQRTGHTLACATALDTARRQLAADFMFDGWENGRADEAKDFVSFVMNGWDDLCPEGGTVYVVYNAGDKVSTDLAWDVVCGLHGSDKKLCTRLNSDNVLGQLREALRQERLLGNPCPESLRFTLHHREYTALLVDEETGFKRGTDLTKGYKGIVAFYAIGGHGALGASIEGEDGEICYFSYADEKHCATWRSDDGWTGDSFQGMK